MQYAAQFFWIEFLTQSRRSHKVTEHHRELAAFARRGRRPVIGSRNDCWQRRGVIISQLGDCLQETAAMAEGRDAQILEVVGGGSAATKPLFGHLGVIISVIAPNPIIPLVFCPTAGDAGRHDRATAASNAHRSGRNPVAG
jgi:hypothetical protein